jgi:hypothetical protein
VTNDLNLDGVEVSIIKALGFGASDISGAALTQRIPELGEMELMSTLKTLLAMGYVEADRSSFGSAEEFRTTLFHVNSGYQRELKESLSPRTQEKPKSRRIRRE